MGRLYNKKDNVKFENLSDRSEKDKVWDTQRKYCDLVSELYFQSAEFEDILNEWKIAQVV